MRPWNELVMSRLRHPALDLLRDDPSVWVVGGAVRDALLGRPPREIDLLVEGDAIAVARRLGTPDAVHERFGTARFGDVDVAAARSETYAQPGGLPEVELGATVAEDLRRRDFTVNALAVRLADGEGASVPGAIEDLDARVLRVLHERSFSDDPTRVLRLARYAARLDFTTDPDTQRLADAATFATVTGARIGAEVRLALGEPLPGALVALPGARAIHPAYDPDPALLEQVLAHVPPGALPGLAALGACLLDAPDVAGALDRLAFRAAERAIVSAVADGARALADAMVAAERPSQIAEAARHRPAEALAVAAALGARAQVARWLHELRHVHVALTGDDLLAAGLRGPAVGAALRAAEAAALDGAAPDRESQLRAALRAVQ